MTLASLPAISFIENSGRNWRPRSAKSINAAVLDRKDVEDHPPIDTGLPRNDRFRKIADLMRSARRDIEQEEDNPVARKWRNAAFLYIDAALDYLHRAAVDARVDHELEF
jgi:hypothetical protein